MKKRTDLSAIFSKGAMNNLVSNFNPAATNIRWYLATNPALNTTYKKSYKPETVNEKNSFQSVDF